MLSAGPNGGSSGAGDPRRLVLGSAVTLAVITYVDRVCIAQAAPFIQADLGLSAAQMGLAFSAFAWAYALFEIPGGWLGDRIGPRRVLVRIVAWWSVFTALTGYVWNLAALVVARFLFGMGEAGCFPNLTKAFAIWLPREERAKAQGIMWLSARWAGAFTPLIVLWVMTWLSWRNTFVLFGAVGCVWAYAFHRLAARHLAAGERRALAHASESVAQAAAAHRFPWGKLLASRSIWLLWIQYFCLTYGWFFYVTWLPTYLQETRGLQLGENFIMAQLGALLERVFAPEMARRILVAALAAIPLFVGGLGAIAAGALTPKLVRAFGSIARVRRLLAGVGFTGASILLVTSIYTRDPLWAMLMMGLASFCNDLTMPGSWSACMDVGGRFAGTVSGSMNMMGSLGAAVAPLMVGLILDHSGRNWALTFWISGAIYFLGGLCWLWLDPVTPLCSDDS